MAKIEKAPDNCLIPVTAVLCVQLKIPTNDMSRIAHACKRLHLLSQTAAGHWLATLIMAGMAIALWDAPGTHDMNTWRGWAQHTAEIGIVQGYAAHPNYYPPLTITVLGFCQKLANALSITPTTMIKLSLSISLVSATLFIYFFSRRNILLTFFAYCAFLLNSLGLIYLDLYFALPLLLAFYCLQQQWWAGFAFCFSVACLVKYQPLMMAPFLAIYLLASLFDRKAPLRSLRHIALSLVLPALLPWVVAIVIFPDGMYRSFLSLQGDTVWLSAQALNADWILTRYLLQAGIEQPFPPGLPPELSMIRAVPEIPGQWMDRIAIVFYLAALGALLLKKNTLENLLYFAILGNLAWFMWHTGAHENHLFLAALLAVLLYALNSVHLPLMLAMVIMSSLNMFLFYGVDGKGPGILPYSVRSGANYDYRYDIYLWVAFSYVLVFFFIWLNGVYRFFKAS